ncbi:MFS transporter [Halobacillus karajensis]|uniref:Nitrate transporter NarT n=1 Tax=Halobacillus karajensis TaxID=195088 RepID=A0A024P414_9BACI|nr:MFS transporter [Halobacillus karajensis]CDQ20761.1 putative nitrate transporter NarT [Halobacillus karajensis]CDQ23769.1 putative nitrate transporter NarT [Halobacillus karajensis]CDQ27247.1 putative nitrate transporter NarT [Halobacillus karajensis]
MGKSYEGNRHILIMSTLAFFVSVMVWFNMAPFNSTIMEQMGISKDEIGVLMLVNLGLAIPARIIMGQWVDRFGPTKVFSSLLMVMSIPCFVFAFGNSYEQLLLSRLLLGSIGASFVIGIRMISEWFPQKSMGLVQGIYAGWGNFGSAMASFSLPLLALIFGGESGWRYAIALTGLLALIYGLIFYRKVADAPPGKEFKRSPSSGMMRVNSHSDLIILVFLIFPIYGGVALLVWSLQRMMLLSLAWAVSLYAFLGVFYLVHVIKIWISNRSYLNGKVPSGEQNSMKLVGVLSLAYFSTFGAELAVISMLPMFFQGNFALGAIGGGMIASSFAFTNLVARPAGGWLSDRFGRKKILVMLLLLLSILYFSMSSLSGDWPLILAVLLTMSCSMVGQAASGSVFSMVPLVKKSQTGQVAGIVGAYGNIGSVCFLAVLNLMFPSFFFITIGVFAFLCSISSFLIKEPGPKNDVQERINSVNNYRYPTEIRQKV